MPVKYVKVIRREDIQADPDVLWCFGDNLAGVGLGGQAKECTYRRAARSISP